MLIIVSHINITLIIILIILNITSGQPNTRLKSPWENSHMQHPTDQMTRSMDDPSELWDTVAEEH